MVIFGLRLATVATADVVVPPAVVVLTAAAAASAEAVSAEAAETY